MTSNRVKERIGINHVSRIVETVWESGWQEYAAMNDDAIDGAIILRRGSKTPRDTGGIVFVQVKCGGNGYRKDQVQHPDHIGVALTSKYVDDHRDRWRRVPGPCVLVFVDETTGSTHPQAWWVDLRQEAAYSSTNAGMLLIPKSQRFGPHTKGDFNKLCGTLPRDREIESLTLNRIDDVKPRLGSSESLRSDAWDFYKNWRGTAGPVENPTLGKVLINRTGWKHITRKGRRAERIIQSWLLLGAAKAIVAKCRLVYMLGRASSETMEDGATRVTDYLGLRARVTFSHRQQSVIQVVLRRQRTIQDTVSVKEKQKIWFYSVYELRRGGDHTY